MCLFPPSHPFRNSFGLFIGHINIFLYRSILSRALLKRGRGTRNENEYTVLSSSVSYICCILHKTCKDITRFIRPNLESGSIVWDDCLQMNSDVLQTQNNNRPPRKFLLKK